MTDDDVLLSTYDRISCAAEEKANIFCFEKGTRVMLGNGSLRNIEMIRPGEAVMSPLGDPVPVDSTVCGQGLMFEISPKQSRSKNGLLPTLHMDTYRITGFHIMVLKCDTIPILDRSKAEDHIFTVKTFGLVPIIPNREDGFSTLIERDRFEFKEFQRTFEWSSEYASEIDLSRAVEAFLSSQSRECLWEIPLNEFLQWRTQAPQSLVDRVRVCWSSEELKMKSQSKRDRICFDQDALIDFVNDLRMRHDVSILENQMNSLDESIAWFLGAWLNGGYFWESKTIALHIPFHRIYNHSTVRPKLKAFASLFGLECQDWYIQNGLRCQGVLFQTAQSPASTFRKPNQTNLLVDLLNTWGFLIAKEKYCQLDLFYSTCLQQTPAFRHAFLQGFMDVSFIENKSHSILIHKHASQIKSLPAYDHETSVDCAIYLCLVIRSLGYRSVVQAEKSKLDVPIIVSFDQFEVDEGIEGIKQMSDDDDEEEKEGCYDDPLPPPSSLELVFSEDGNNDSSDLLSPLLSTDPDEIISAPGDRILQQFPWPHLFEKLSHEFHVYEFDVIPLDDLRPFFGIQLSQEKRHLHKFRFLLSNLQVVHNCGETPYLHSSLSSSSVSKVKVKESDSVLLAEKTRTKQP